MGKLNKAMTGMVLVMINLLMAVPANAQDDAYLSILHGVPGLTVDVYVNGDLLIDDFEPGTLTDPLPLPAGTYSVALTAEDAVDDSSPVLGPIDLPLAAGRNYTAAAFLDASAAPTAALFENDTAAANLDDGKLTVRHLAANAEGVEVLASGGSLGTFNNGQELGPFVVPPGSYDAEVKAGMVTVPPTPVSVEVLRRDNLIIYAWGSADDLQLATQRVQLFVRNEPVPSMGMVGLMLLILSVAGLAFHPRARARLMS